jgi:ABC-type nitrate/sulfonate/bicarbonate transport system permease component
MTATQDAVFPGTGDPAMAARREVRRKVGRGLLQVLGSPLTARLLFPVAVLIFWVVSMEVIKGAWPSAFEVLPAPSEVWDFMWAELALDTVAPYNLFETFLISLQRLGIGMLIALGLGTVIGLAMGLSKGANAFFNDWVVAVLAMPTLAWALFVSLAFGFGDSGPIIVVVLTGIPFVIINVREGVRNTPRDLFDMARAFRVPRSRVIRQVLLPSLMPFMFAAARYSFALGWKGVVVAEVFGGQDGAGWTIKFWYDAHRAHGVVGYAFFFMIFAVVFERLVFDSLAKRVFRWRPAVTGVEVAEDDFGAEVAAAAPVVAASGTQQSP